MVGKGLNKLQFIHTAEYHLKWGWGEQKIEKCSQYIKWEFETKYIQNNVTSGFFFLSVHRKMTKVCTPKLQQLISLGGEL